MRYKIAFIQRMLNLCLTIGVLRRTIRSGNVCVRSIVSTMQVDSWESLEKENTHTRRRCSVSFIHSWYHMQNIRYAHDDVKNCDLSITRKIYTHTHSELGKHEAFKHCWPPDILCFSQHVIGIDMSLCVCLNGPVRVYVINAVYRQTDIYVHTRLYTVCVYRRNSRC